MNKDRRVKTTTTMRLPINIDLHPAEAIYALQREIIYRMNTELISLDLPDMPPYRFESFALRGGKLYGLTYWPTGQGVMKEFEVTWGVTQFIKMWEKHQELTELRDLLA